MRWRALLPLLLPALLVGCATEEPVRSTSWLGRLRPLQPGTAANVVLMDVALIEQPAGDPYLDRALWDAVDEQVIALERRGAVEDNGFRVGLVSGMTPAGLQALLGSERSCANPRRIQRQAGDPTTLHLGLERPRCRYRLHPDGDAAVELEQAQCSLVVVPTLAGEGRVRLQFTPQVRHGPSALVPRPSADRSGTYSWMLQEKRPTETYAGLGWELTLAPNEYAVVGGRADRAETLGQQFFVRGDEPAPVQRLLVVRATRLHPSTPIDQEELLRSPPLALQAAWGSR